MLYNPATMRVERYRFRGAQIPNPWNQEPADPNGARHRRRDRDEHAILGYLQEALA